MATYRWDLRRMTLRRKVREGVKRYLITSATSMDSGEYEGTTKAAALLAQHRDEGYGDEAVWLSEDGTHLEFRSDEERKLLGDVDDWHFEEVELREARAERER